MSIDDEFQGFLDAISNCFLKPDFEAWRSRTLLPFSMVTRRGPEVFETEAALRENFEHYLTACDVLRIDMIHRKPLALEPSPDGTWVGTYETNLLSAGKRATAPYTSSVLLERTETGLKMRSILNARGHHDWTGTGVYS